MWFKKIFLGCLIFDIFLFASETTVSQNTIQSALADYFNKELNDVQVSQELATILMHQLLSWKIPTIDSSQISTIIAYSFGNRILANGNRSPGPTNEALADQVVQLHLETKAPIYAQWEIIEAIGNRISPEHMTAINPTLDAQGNVVYLSTIGVTNEILKLVSNPERLGTAAIIAFNDHLPRCITIAHNLGIDAYAPQGYIMPNVYDQNSGQPWTRDRLTYLLTDINARIQNYLSNQ